MNLNLYQQTNPVTGTNKLVAAIYEDTAPSVLINSYIFPTPYTGQTQLVNFNGLDSVVYIYKLFESVDGTPTGTVRNTFQIQPGNNTFNVREDIFLVADVSPFLANGTNFYGVDSSLVGWDWYVERVPATMQPDVEYSKTKAGVVTGISDTDADGWVLDISGDIVAVNEKFVIHFYPQLQVSQVNSAAKLISTTTLLKTTTILDNTAAGTSLLLQGTGNYFDVTLPDLATISDNTPIYIISSGGAHINVGINCFGSQKLQYKTGVSKIVLGQDESMMVYKYTYTDSSFIWLINAVPDGVKNVGQIIWSHTKNIPNTIWGNGALISRTGYNRLAVYGLALPETVTLSAWSNIQPYDGVNYFVNKGKYNKGDGSSTFGIPDITAYGFIRAADAVNRFVGQLDPLQLLQHKHPSKTGTIGDQGKAEPQSTGSYGGATHTNPDLTGLPYNNVTGNTVGTIITRQGTENRPDNINLYALICC